MKTRNVASISVSSKLMLDALGFPPGTTLIAIDPAGVAWPGVAKLIVEHPDLPAVPAGEYPPQITPRLTITGSKPHTYIKWDWRTDER